MIYLLSTLVFAEMLLILGLLFRTPLRKLVMVGLDQLKRGSGRTVAKTIALTMFVIFAATVYGTIEIYNHFTEGGQANPTDEVLMAKQLLEATLMGFNLFLLLVIDRLHYYVKELYLVRNDLRSAARVKKPSYDRKYKDSEEIEEKKAK